MMESVITQQSDHRAALLARCRNKRVLLMAHSIYDMVTTREKLVAYGLHVDIAVNGKHALQYLARRSRYDLVVVDLDQHEDEGLAVSQRVLWQERKPCVIAHSKVQSKDWIQKLADAGVEGLLPKRCMNQQLEDCLIQHLH